MYTILSNKTNFALNQILIEITIRGIVILAR